MSDEQAERSLDAAVGVVRRAPFSDNPVVGARGQRTQRRILDAALRAFADEGYHNCSVDRITKTARCSRVSFYQYFASKEEVFRQLAGQVARQVSASTEALDPLTPDRRGWVAMRAWVARYAEIHGRYRPVFHSVEGDEVLADLARRTGEETLARIHARLDAATLSPRQLDPVIRLLLESLNYTLDVSDILRSVAPDGYPRERVEVAITNVVHRTLFGPLRDVDEHSRDCVAPPVLEFGPEMLELLPQEGAVDPDAAGNAAFDALLASARDVFVHRGYHGTRVSDLVAAAGVSHGAFYRYFGNKEQLARILTARAVQGIGTAIAEIPDAGVVEGATGAALLRRWLRRYHNAHASETLMLRVWADAALQEPTIRAESAPLFDWGRRRMSHYLRPRGFGDVDIEAVVMVALLGVFGSRPRTLSDVDAAVHIIECGLLGH